MKEQALKNYNFKTPEVEKVASTLINLYLALMQREQKKKEKHERKREPDS